MARRRIVTVEEHERVLENLRETRFKLNAFNKMLQYARKHIPEEAKSVIDGGISGLVLHTRGEKPLKWVFDGEEITEI